VIFNFLMDQLLIVSSLASITSFIVTLVFQWNGSAETQRNIAFVFSAACLGMAVWRVRVLRARRPDDALIEYTDEIGISMAGSEHTIHYPRPFARPPNLRLDWNVTFPPECKVLEQRADGFRLETQVAGSGPLRLRWTAKGEPAH
jgi:hypothetical protein